MQVLYLGRAPRTKETLPDFLKWRRVTQRPLVFRGLTGSERTPDFGASHMRRQKRSEFVHLQQGGMTVTEYASQFTLLSGYAQHMVASKQMRAE